MLTLSQMRLEMVEQQDDDVEEMINLKIISHQSIKNQSINKQFANTSKNNREYKSNKRPQQTDQSPS